MITAILLGAIALGIMGAAHKQSGVGALRKAKRRIYNEMAAVQESEINLEKDFSELDRQERESLQALAKHFGFKGTSRSTKSVEEQFYNSIQRRYKAISGIGRTTLPAQHVSVITNGRGDKIMEYIDYGSDEWIEKNALGWFYDEFVAPGLNGFNATIYYIATGGKFLWDGGKDGVKRGVKNEVFATSGKATAERKMRISYLSKDGITIDRFAESIHPSNETRAYNEDEIRNGVIDALREFISVGDCKRYIVQMYIDYHTINDDEPAENYLPF